MKHAIPANKIVCNAIKRNVNNARQTFIYQETNAF